MAVKTNEIRIGDRENPSLSLENEDLISITGNLACDLLCEEIPIDTLEIQCRYDRLFRQFAPADYDGLETAEGKLLYTREGGAGSARKFPWATPAWYFHDGEYVGKFYLTDGRRTGKRVYTLEAVSAIGVLDAMPYYGGLYASKPLTDVLRDILLTDGLQETATPFLTQLYGSIVLGDGLEDITVTGHIPVCSKRKALHHVLFAHGLNILKSENDAFLITRINDFLSGDIDPKDCYEGGSVDLTEPIRTVEVTEHSYINQGDREKLTLYDNTTTNVDAETLVVFDSAPIVVSSLSVTGTLKIKTIATDSGTKALKNENCAVVTGIGTLTGRPYAHTTLVVSRVNGNVSDGKAKTVKEATLIHALNSDAAADRLFAYYTKKQTMQMAVSLVAERCGSRYRFTSPYDEAETGYLAGMRITASAIARAECELVTGYLPDTGAEEMRHMVLLTGSGVFMTPAEVLASGNPRMRVVLIGGGQGGGHGFWGMDGASSSKNTGAEKSGTAGRNGKSGSHGKLRIVQLRGDQITESFAYSCGSGGKQGDRRIQDSGGTAQSWGYDGGDTLFGEHSSFNGTVPDTGYLDVLTGDLYGGPGYDWTQRMHPARGGYPRSYWNGVEDHGYMARAGGDGSVPANEEMAKRFGCAVGELLDFTGGDPGKRAADTRAPGQNGSGGGGPVVRQAGEPIPAEYNGSLAVYDNASKTVTLGNGGRGADGVDAPSPMSLYKIPYGKGGIGGCGGAGGGAAGCVGYLEGWNVIDGIGGKGGAGGLGSDGAPGCILVYY